ncbi:hypothetical protein HUU53_00740 [Candidatus Micrarchaeota archaeon]|nr:hypothetical protein [Candidatus Micrarchaeota archaeon]
MNLRGEIFTKVMIFTIGAFLIGTQLVNLANFLNGVTPTMNIYEMALWWTVFLMGALMLQSPSMAKEMAMPSRPARKAARRRR